MCDTQVFIDSSGLWFAKNSDREAAEPQWVKRYPAVNNSGEATVQTTYLNIPQVPDRHGVILSQPVWCWGAEMGVNDQGVCIGNEAVFSTTRTLEKRLLGMDLVRLGLERAATAEEAVQVITRLLEKHGQGGPAGFHDGGFHYDNSYLIADRTEAWVLETADRHWVAKRISHHYAISNGYTLSREADLRSDSLKSAKKGFRETYDTRLMPLLAGSRARRDLSIRCLSRNGGMSFPRLASHLRSHNQAGAEPLAGSNKDVCMHAAGLVRRSQTTGSMLVRITPQQIRAFFTGTSAPCLSIFRPVGFHGDFSVLAEQDQTPEECLWSHHEPLHRLALADSHYRSHLQETRDACEEKLFACEDSGEADKVSCAWHGAMAAEAAQATNVVLPRYWRNLSHQDGLGPCGGAPDIL